MSRRADLESQIVALRAADATLEKRLASQDEKIDEYERRRSVSEASGGSPLAFVERMPVVGPAILAVALMLETRAATMAIGKGCDIAEYQRLVQQAHELRAAVGESHEQYAAEAMELYDELTQPSPSGWSSRRGLTRMISPEERELAHPPSG